MASAPPPTIFAPARRLAVRRRMLALQRRPDAAHYLIDDMIEDTIERLAFLRQRPAKALIIGDWTGDLASALAAQGTQVTSAEPAAGFEQEVPFPHSGFDFIASLGTLDSANDLPGALIHIRQALASGGLMIASFIGAGSLPALRAAMLEADGERPAPRLHPMVDVRAGGQLLQRAGFADPVVDSRSLEVRFSGPRGLIADLARRVWAMCWPVPARALGKTALAMGRQAFGAANLERFEILTLSGWRK